MKKLTNFLMIFVLFSVILASCNKDENMINQKQTQDPTEQKILAFKAKVENPVKTDETFSVDSAVWYIEAALNYEYCQVDSTNDITIGSAFISVPLLNEEITLTELINSYNTLESKLTSIVGNEKMQVSDISYSTNNNKEDEITLILTTISTKGSTYISTFGPNENWYAFAAGRCGGQSGDYNKNAITEIPLKANMVRPLPYGNNYYITDVEEVQADGYPNSEYFFWISNDHYYCMSSSELNHYLEKLKEFAELDDIKPTGKTIIHYNLIYDGIVKKSKDTEGHSPILRFGIYHHSSMN